MAGFRFFHVVAVQSESKFQKKNKKMHGTSGIHRMHAHLPYTKCVWLPHLVKPSSSSLHFTMHRFTLSSSSPCPVYLHYLFSKITLRGPRICTISSGTNIINNPFSLLIAWGLREIGFQIHMYVGIFYFHWEIICFESEFLCWY